MDTDCCMAIISTNKLCMLVDQIYEYQNFGPFLVRIAFVLANITTYYDEAREQMGEYDKSMERIVTVCLAFFNKEESGSSDKVDKKPPKKGDSEA